jgi:hypothetical protein
MAYPSRLPAENLQSKTIELPIYLLDMTQLWIGILLAAGAAAPSGPERVFESVVPGLAYGPACRSVVELANLGGRSAVVEVEGHRASGALVPAGTAANPVVLAPGGRASFRLDIEEETSGAWVKVRERIPSPDQGPVVAAHGTTECLDGDRLRTVSREAAFPMRDPWFAEEVGALTGGVIALINTGEQPAGAALCYSAGNLYSVPRRDRSPPPLEPVCSEALAAQIPPFGSREFPLERNGNRWFSIRTRGPSIVLQMLRPVEAGVQMYVVDSTIQFGSEVPPSTSR